MHNTFLFISGQEIFIILLIVLILFGADKIPSIARTLGKGFREVQKATDDIKKEMNNHTNDIAKDVKDIDEDIKKVKDDLKG